MILPILFTVQSIFIVIIWWRGENAYGFELVSSTFSSTSYDLFILQHYFPCVNALQNSSASREQVKFQWNDYEVRFVLEQHDSLIILVLTRWNNSPLIDMPPTRKHYPDSDPISLMSWCFLCSRNGDEKRPCCWYWWNCWHWLLKLSFPFTIL